MHGFQQALFAVANLACESPGSKAVGIQSKSAYHFLEDKMATCTGQKFLHVSFNKTKAFLYGTKIVKLSYCTYYYLSYNIKIIKYASKILINTFQNKQNLLHKERKKESEKK